MKFSSAPLGFTRKSIHFCPESCETRQPQQQDDNNITTTTRATNCEWRQQPKRENKPPTATQVEQTRAQQKPTTKKAQQ